MSPAPFMPRRRIPRPSQGPTGGQPCPAPDAFPAAPAVLTHFQRGEVSRPGNEGTEGKHDQPGSRRMYSERQGSRPRRRWRRPGRSRAPSNEGRSSDSSQPPGRSGRRSGRSIVPSLHRIAGHEGCAGSDSKCLRRTVPLVTAKVCFTVSASCSSSSSCRAADAGCFDKLEAEFGEQSIEQGLRFCVQIALRRGLQRPNQVDGLLGLWQRNWNPPSGCGRWPRFNSAAAEASSNQLKEPFRGFVGEDGVHGQHLTRKFPRSANLDRRA